MSTALLTPKDVDNLLRYPNGRAARLAKAEKIPHITLPDGSIRFREKDIEALIGSNAPQPIGEILPGVMADINRRGSQGAENDLDQARQGNAG